MIGNSETSFSVTSDKPHRRVEMWLTSHVLVCKFNNKYFGTPLSNVVDFE